MTFGLRCLRSAGHVLPLSLIWLLLWPFAMGLATVLTWRERRDGRLDSLNLLARPGLGSFFGAAVERANVILTRLLFVWPEKMASPHFNRCRIEGAEHMALLKPGGRPVVLASLHFGPMTVGGEWLRSRGHPVAAVAVIALVQRSAFRRACGQTRDRLAHLEHVPPFIEVGHVMSMREQLEKHGLLGVAVEGGYGKHTTFPTVGDVGLCVRTGTFKLAEMTGARVIPFLVEARPFFRFTLHFCQPIPDDEIADRHRHDAAAEHLLRELLPILRRRPGQCTDFLFHALRPANAPAANAATAGKVLQGVLRAG